MFSLAFIDQASGSLVLLNDILELVLRDVPFESLISVLERNSTPSTVVEQASEGGGEGNHLHIPRVRGDKKVRGKLQEFMMC